MSERNDRMPNPGLHIVLSVAGFMPDSFGGGQVYVERLAKELQRRGRRVTVLAFTGWVGPTGGGAVDAEEYRYEGLRVVRCALNPAVLSPVERQGGLGPASISLIRGVLADLTPDLVHTDDSRAAVLKACELLHLPTVMTVHHPGVACLVGNYMTPAGAICTKAMSVADCIPCSCSRRAGGSRFGNMLGASPPWLFRPIGMALNAMNGPTLAGRALMYPWMMEQRLLAYRAALASASVIIAPSQSIANQLLLNGVAHEKIRVEAHGIDPLERQPRLPPEGRPLTFGYIGRIDPGKGLHVIAAALAKLGGATACKLLIAGKAQEAESQRYLDGIVGSQAGAIRIEHFGYVPADQIAFFFSQIDVLIVPSLAPEGFGLVVAEAFSAGRPVIVSNIGALQEQVEDGINGFVYPSTDSDALAHVLRNLIENPHLVARLGKGIPSVRTTQEYTDIIERIYEEQRTRSNERVGRGLPCGAHQNEPN